MHRQLYFGVQETRDQKPTSPFLAQTYSLNCVTLREQIFFISDYWTVQWTGECRGDLCYLRRNTFIIFRHNCQYFYCHANQLLWRKNTWSVWGRDSSSVATIILMYCPTQLTLPLSTNHCTVPSGTVPHGNTEVLEGIPFHLIRSFLNARSIKLHRWVYSLVMCHYAFVFQDIFVTDG